MLAVVAEDEIKRLGMRVSHVLAELRARGWYQVTPNLPWGCTSRPATDDERRSGAPMSVLEVHSLSAPCVVEAFGRAAAGDSLRSIARWSALLPPDVRGLRFNDDPERAARRRKVVRDQARMCTMRFVQGLLRNPVYAGKFERDGEQCGKWHALIEDEIWFTVQKRLDDHAAAPHAKRNSFLLTAFVRCGRCHGSMHGETYSWRDAGGHSATAALVHVVGPTNAPNRVTSQPLKRWSRQRSGRC